MKKIHSLYCLVAVVNLLLCNSLVAQTGAALTAEDSAQLSYLRRVVTRLAANDMEGRLTGSKGVEKAAHLIAGELQRMQLEKLPGLPGEFRQPFEFIAGLEADSINCMFEVRKPAAKIPPFTPMVDFRPLGFSANDTATGTAAFAGFGIVLPDGSYDSYAGIDVKNKIVFVVEQLPENISIDRRQELSRYSGLRYKASIAQQRGAKALIIISRRTTGDKLPPLTLEQGTGSSNLPILAITYTRAVAIFEAIGKKLDTTLTALSYGKTGGGYLLPNLELQLRVAVKKKRGVDRNVIALLRADTNITPENYIVIGAHYDHIGRGEISSLATDTEVGQIHNGADDNASGVGVVLTIAQRLLPYKNRLEKTGIIFAFWTGEEMGLLGSHAFCEQAPIPLAKIRAYINFDMVGRLRNNQLSVQGTGSAAGWDSLVRVAGKGLNLTYNFQSDPYLPTDLTSFYLKKIPGINFFTGGHAQYHRPSDDADLLNFEGMFVITQLATALVQELITKRFVPVYQAVEQKAGAATGSRAPMPVTVGTIPDYTTADTLQGMKLSGVRAGSPAEKAGIQPGDIIVGFAGKPIRNIYDYTYLLSGLKAGEPVKAIILRNGKKIELTVIPQEKP
jgi:hypothetical protein